MNFTILLSVVSLAFAFLLLVEINKKPLPKKGTLRMFTYFAILCVIGPMIEMVHHLIPVDELEMRAIIYKSFLLQELLWCNVFAMIIWSIANDENKLGKEKSEGLKRKANMILIPILVLVSILIIISPVNFTVENDILAYVSGTATNIFYYAAEGYGILCLIIILMNIKQVGARKYAPFLIFIVIGISSLLVQSEHKSISLLVTSATLIEYMIYFELKNNSKS